MTTTVSRAAWYILLGWAVWDALNTRPHALYSCLHVSLIDPQDP